MGRLLKQWFVFGIFVILITTVFPHLLENGLVSDAGAETWTQTSTNDFYLGDRTFVDIEGGTLRLANGPKRITFGIGEAANDELGTSVSGAGDVNGDGYDDIIIGAPGNDDAGTDAGEVYVYYGSPIGYELKPDWSDQGVAAGDLFGCAVAGAGDINNDGYDDIIIGAKGNDSGGSNAGEVYVYLGSPIGVRFNYSWSEQGGAAGDEFGGSVSGAGDVNGDGFDDILIGAMGNDSGGNDAGEAYLYYGSLSGINTTLAWSDQGEAAGDSFGFSVSRAGDVNNDGYNDIIIGANGSDSGGSNAGKAYVYNGSANGTSTIPYWSDHGEAINDSFGYSVSTAGDVNGDGYDDIIVGANGNDSWGNDSGKAYVYNGSPNGISAIPFWYDHGLAANNSFGCSVSTAGDVNRDGYADILVGANGSNYGGNDTGAVFMYYGSSSGLINIPDWFELGEATNDSFGISVSGAGDVNGDGYDEFIIGAYHNDDNGTNAGKAYLFWITTDWLFQSWCDYGETAGDRFGYDVSSAGDVNDDGYDDIIVGAFSNDGNGTDAGKAYVYHGSSNSLSTTPNWSAFGEAANDAYGYSLSGAGDVNGDGYDDVIVGARYNDDGGTNAGEAYMYFGSSGGLSATPNWSDQGEAAYDYFGIDVSGAGDVNGDGYDDIIIGATGNDGAGSAAGEAYIYFGSSNGPGATPNWSDRGESANDYFGNMVSRAGDVNGDGYDDIIIGASANDDGGTDAGEIYMYFGSSTGPSSSPGWAVQGEAIYNYIGYVGTGHGDLNGDGYDDIIVSTYLNNEGGTNAGKVYIYYGNGAGLSTTPGWTALGEAANDNFGIKISGVKDINNDGYDDILIGASGNDDGGDASGKAYIYAGSPIGPVSEPIWFRTGDSENEWFGHSLSFAGDVNNDGYNDVIICSSGKDRTGTDAGAAYLFYMAPYAKRGRFISDTIAINGFINHKWLSLDWKPFVQPFGTIVRFQIATNDDGCTWNFVGPDGTANSYYTNAPGQLIPSDQLGNYLKVKIYLTTSINTSTPFIYEFSINYLYYKDPSVVLTSPNGGEDWMRNQYYPITWYSEGEFNSTPVCLYNSSDNGATWWVIEKWITNNGHYNWTVPNYETPSALIKITITDISGETVLDVSDASFAIDPPPPSWSGNNDLEQTGPEPSSNPDESLETNIEAGKKQNDDNDKIGIYLGLSAIIIIIAISLILNIIFVKRLKVAGQQKSKAIETKKVRINPKMEKITRKPRRPIDNSEPLRRRWIK